MAKNHICKISVLMPAYNARKYISEAIESVLNQTFKDFEFIIIDDCSTDKTLEIIEDYAKKDSRIIALRNEVNLKMSHTLNKGLALAKGKYIARMDADDWCHPERLYKQFVFMENNPEIGISGGSMNICDENLNVKSLRKYNLTDREIKKNIFKYSPFCHPSIIIKKEVFDRVGRYDANFNPAEDYELYFRIGEFYKFGNLDDVLLRYRVVEKSMTTGFTKKMELKTIAIRNRYSKKYNMSFFDRIYNFLHRVSVHLVPPKFKIMLFNFLRNNSPLYKVIAIWHGVYRKGGVHEPNIFSDGVFLNKHFPDRIIISNSLYAGGKTTVSFYVGNNLIRKKEFLWIKRLPDILRYIIESALNLFYLVRYGKYATVLAVDPLSSLMPCVLKKIGHIKKVLFLSPDYARKRFGNPLLNKIYFLIDSFCTHAADVNICNAQTVIDYKKYKYPAIRNQFHMPNIPPSWIIEKYKNIQKVKGKIIYVGDLGKDANIGGFKELFEAIKSLEKEIPDIKLFVAGDGDYKNKLIEFAESRESIVFLGPLSHELAIKQIAESEIGIAMYNGDNNYDEFRDSMKVREYQSLGAIPITTNVVRSNKDEILKYNSGILLDEFKSDCLKRSILSVMKDEQLKNNLRINSVYNSEIYKNKYRDLLKLI